MIKLEEIICLIEFTSLVTTFGSERVVPNTIIKMRIITIPLFT